MYNLSMRAHNLIKVIVCFLILSHFNIQSAHAATYKLTVNIKVSSVLFSEDTVEDAVSVCKIGKNRFNDFIFKLGSTIKVLNESDKTVGLGKITSASFVREDDPGLLGNQNGYLMGYCAFKGVVKVKKADFYSILIDGRGGAEFDFSDLKTAKWKINLFI